MRRVATPAGACGVIGFAVATVNATLTFINIFGGGESGEDSGQCGVRGRCRFVISKGVFAEIQCIHVLQ